MENARSVADEVRGLEMALVFGMGRIYPLEEPRWEKRTAEIKDEKGMTIFRQEEVEVPDFWSQLSLNVVASKYFYGELGTLEREWSVKHLIHRVARTIADWGIQDGYFAAPDDGERFYRQLVWLLVNQHGSFNSPVWFNVGLYHNFHHGRIAVAQNDGGPRGHYRYHRPTGETENVIQPYEFPQCAACFIQSVEDNMESIMELAFYEAMLFKYGSGTGTDLSNLRSMREKLAGGGRPSGPVSFLKIFDEVAKQIKSGGKTRRAAKMNTLKIWHPDILEFIMAKWKEEKKAQALIRQGYGADFNDEAYSTVAFQNVNVSVRVTREFMELVKNNGLWQTLAVTTGKPYISKKGREEQMPVYNAKELLYKIAEAAWHCGDPGIQYEDTIQLWHTCPNFEPINSSNPCSEYMSIDNSACNLASVNLMKFRRADGTFDVEKFRAAVRIFIIAQEIIVDNASYPTKKIARNAHLFRQLGLGYANLGSYLMSLGLPYDSDEARGIAGALTAIMTGEAYSQSARIAAIKGPFAAFAGEGKMNNREPMLRVMRQHQTAVGEINAGCPAYLREAARNIWQEAVELGERFGYRNAQATVIAPTGTIAFMMDCDTTGVEPELALVKYKLLAGGGMIKIINRTVPLALERLGYGPAAVKEINDYVDRENTIEGAPELRTEHLAVFDCAFPAPTKNRAISWQAHVKMMAAVQPFVSGAISKTVNMPRESTIEDIVNVYEWGWRMGLKALAVYRDGSKKSQPLSAGPDQKEEGGEAITIKPKRERLPDTRQSITHKFSIHGHEGYITVGLYEDGRPGELFINMAKEGSTIGGLMDAVGITTSLSLQYGVPLEALVKKFEYSRFEPAGPTKNPEIPMAKSLVDYIFRWLGIKFIPGYREKYLRREDNSHQNPGPNNPATVAAATFAQFQTDAPACDECGAITVRLGSCFTCFNCGTSKGCS